MRSPALRITVTSSVMQKATSLPRLVLVVCIYALCSLHCPSLCLQLFYSMYKCLPACMYGTTVCVLGTFRGWKRMSCPQELAVQRVVSQPVGAREQTQVLAENRKCP